MHSISCTCLNRPPAPPSPPPPAPPPESCKQHRDASASPLGDGTFALHPASGNAYDAHCDMTTAGGGWTLVATIANSDDYHGWTAARWTSPDAFGSCSVVADADCKSGAWSSLSSDELLVVESRDGSVGKRTWMLDASRTLHTVFSTLSMHNLYVSSTLVQSSATTNMALAYETDPGYLLVNADLDGSDCYSTCTPFEASCLTHECNDGCHLVGWWTRHRPSGSNQQCSSGLSCKVDKGNSYTCGADVSTNGAGSYAYNTGASRSATHTVWLYVR